MIGKAKKDKIRSEVFMKTQKVSGAVLKRSVINIIGQGPRAGIDCGVLLQDHGTYLLSSTSVSLANHSFGPELAVIKGCNNIWAAGGEVLGIQNGILLQETYEETDLKKITRSLLAGCNTCSTKILGGHTQWSQNLRENCVTVTVMGTSSTPPKTVKQVQAGMDILVTKWIGLEEIVLLMEEEEVRNRLFERFAPEYLEPVGAYANWLKIQEEAGIGKQLEDVIMHDISDGGVFAALWDLSEGAQTGFSVDLKKIPVLQEIIEICTCLDLDPYRAKSSGCLLMMSHQGQKLLEALQHQGIPAAIIGCMTDNRDKIIHNDEEIRYLDRY